MGRAVCIGVIEHVQWRAVAAKGIYECTSGRKYFRRRLSNGYATIDGFVKTPRTSPPLTPRSCAEASLQLGGPGSPECMNGEPQERVLVYTHKHKICALH